jgi:hypothetical protein
MVREESASDFNETKSTARVRTMKAHAMQVDAEYETVKQAMDRHCAAIAARYEDVATWRAMLADMPPEWVARQLSTKVLRDVLVSRGYDVTKPAEKEARDYE